MDNDLYCSCNEFPNLIALLTMPFLTAYSCLYKYVSHLFVVLVYFPCVLMLPFHLRRNRQALSQSRPQDDVRYDQTDVLMSSPAWHLAPLEDESDAILGND